MLLLVANPDLPVPQGVHKGSAIVIDAIPKEGERMAAIVTSAFDYQKRAGYWSRLNMLCLGFRITSLVFRMGWDTSAATSRVIGRVNVDLCTLVEMSDPNLFKEWTGESVEDVFGTKITNATHWWVVDKNLRLFGRHQKDGSYLMRWDQVIRLHDGISAENGFSIEPTAPLQEALLEAV